MKLQNFPLEHSFYGGTIIVITCSHCRIARFSWSVYDKVLNLFWPMENIFGISIR